MSDDPIRPANLRARGSALWAELVKPGASIETRVVIAEACRLADRLDAYDEALTGVGDDKLTPTALAGLNSEARLTAATLQRILAGLGTTSGAAKGTPPPSDDGDGTTTASTIQDEVAHRRAARQANTSG